MKILASDVGGTHVRLAFVEEKDGILTASGHETLKSADFPVFEDALRRYLEKHPGNYDLASFSIAAPIIDGSAKFPNRPWTLNRDKLGAFLGKETVYLLNDLQSQAYGLVDVPKKDTEVIRAGTPENEGCWALVAPGTGLGQALIHRGEGDYFVMKSEGGHASFGAVTPLHWDLLRFLEKEMDHVSWEAVLSGPGIFRLYRFLREHTGKEENSSVVRAMNDGDPSAVVTSAGMSGESEIAAQACELFVELLARFASDLALDGFATGGLYIGGGVVPHLLPLLKQPVFLKTFSHKGRMSGLLENVPITVVRSEMLGILGAARYAQAKIKHEKKILSMLRRNS